MFLLNKKVTEGTSSKHIPPFNFSLMMQKLSVRNSCFYCDFMQGGEYLEFRLNPLYTY